MTWEPLRNGSEAETGQYLIKRKVVVAHEGSRDTRTPYASRALALGESLTMIGRLLGHSKVGTTARYAHLVHDAEKAAAARTGDSIGAHLVPQAVEAA